MADIRLVKRDTVLPPLRHMDWDVVIDGIPHYVIRLEGYVHSIGGRYGKTIFGPIQETKPLLLRL